MVNNLRNIYANSFSFVQSPILSIIGSSKQEERENIALRLGQKTIRAYELPTDKARSDTTSFSVYHQPRTETDEENLLNFGYSKDRRPDLVQYRQMLATSGLYSGNPKRTTFRPTAEQLLAAFSDLTLYLYPDGSTEFSSLNSLQKQILLLMKIPESIYIVPNLVPG